LRTRKPEHVGFCVLCGSPANFLDVERRALVCEEHRPPRSMPEPASFIRGSFTDRDGQIVLGDWLPDDVEITGSPCQRSRRKQEKEPGG
jgi:hypothetical protein